MGETLRSVFGKAIGFAKSMDPEDVALVSRQREAILVVDDANVFISVNRIVPLGNVCVLWHKC